jgi:hypothetical protein
MPLISFIVLGSTVVFVLNKLLSQKKTLIISLPRASASALVRVRVRVRVRVSHG